MPKPRDPKVVARALTAVNKRVDALTQRIGKAHATYEKVCVVGEVKQQAVKLTQH